MGTSVAVETLATGNICSGFTGRLGGRVAVVGTLETFLSFFKVSTRLNNSSILYSLEDIVWVGLVLDEASVLVAAVVVADEVFSETFLLVSETFASAFLHVETVPVNAKYNKRQEIRNFYVTTPNDNQKCTHH